MKKPKKAPKPPPAHHHHKHPHPQRHHPQSHQPARGWGGAPKPVTHKPVVRKHKPVVHHHAKAKKHPVRKLALGEGVACCSAEALAASLRLAGAAVSDSDVLTLHHLAGGTENGGVSILAALKAASAHGLAGVRPVSFRPARIGETEFQILGVDLPGSHAVATDGDTWWSWGEPYCPCQFPGAVIEEAWLVDWEV